MPRCVEYAVPIIKCEGGRWKMDRCSLDGRSHTATADGVFVFSKGHDLC